MSTAPANIIIPPFGTMYLDGTWVQTLFFGFNCVLFPTSIYILTTRRQTFHMFLVAVTCLLYAFSVSYLGLSIAALHGAFANPAVLAVPHGPDLYYAAVNARIPVAKTMIYTCTVFTQDLLLIWRLYIVWGHRWQVAIVPFIVECVHIACALVAAGLLSRPNAAIFAHTAQAWGIAGWSLDIAVNTCVTLAIAGRLWYMDRQLSAVLSRKHSHRAAIFTVIESGGIFACATLALFIMDLCGLQSTYVGIDIIEQIAVLTPLLLIVRVGLGLTHGDSGPTAQQASTRMQWVKSSSAGGANNRSTGSAGLTTQYAIPLRDRSGRDIEVKTDTFISD